MGNKTRQNTANSAGLRQTSCKFEAYRCREPACFALIVSGLGLFVKFCGNFAPCFYGLQHRKKSHSVQVLSLVSFTFTLKPLYRIPQHLYYGKPLLTVPATSSCQRKNRCNPPPKDRGEGQQERLTRKQAHNDATHRPKATQQHNVRFHQTPNRYHQGPDMPRCLENGSA